jgi:hypothetical protein
MVWAAAMVFDAAVMMGVTVIPMTAAVSERMPEFEILRYQVLTVRAPGAYPVEVAPEILAKPAEAEVVLFCHTYV